MPNGDFLQLLKSKFSLMGEEPPCSLLTVPKKRILEMAKFLKENSFENCHCITAVDRKTKIEMVYHFYSTFHRMMLTIKTDLELNDLNIDSMAPFWKSADWFEREVYDLFGVTFINHPNLKRIMNPDEWTVFPLRKDFQRPDFLPRPQSAGLNK
jgi:NADH-quinone oxidoreductase subunit C